ncbi:MAG TPA: HAD family hydrolase [Ktedonobacterales bacterium]|nr:HAD family hydrolase [Ktedonobacterales bacterium]
MTWCRLVAADLDGTLLDAAGCASAATRETVQALRDAGVVLALATARRYTGAAPAAEDLGLLGPVIVCDGALTCTYPSAEVLEREALPAAIAHAAASVLAAHGLRPLVQYWDGGCDRLRIGPAADGAAHEAAYLARYSQQVTELSLDRLCADSVDPLRLVAFGPPDRLAPAARELRSLACGVQVLPMGSYGTAELTVFSPTASKGAALRALARRLGVPLAATFAIGDGLNDRSLFAAAGFSVAMEGAPADLLDLADAVAPPNDRDGAAIALRRYVLDRDTPPHA